MNENERAVFEKEKENARRRIDEMYRAKPQENSGVKMPHFATQGRTQNREHENHTEKPPKPQEPKSEEHGNENQKPTEKHEPAGFNILKMLNFNNIKMDNDRLIILMLCLLLSGDNADDKLLLALAYIML